MTQLYRTAAPQALFTGFKDNPLPGSSNLGVTTPQFCPLSFILAEWGSHQEAYYINGQLTSIFGGATWDVEGPYYKHSHDFVQNIYQKNANAQFVIRLKPEGAKTAMIRLALEYVLVDDIVKYERNPDRSYKRDANGDLIEESTGNEGYKIRMTTIEIQETGEDTDPLVFGQGKVAEGTLVGKAGVKSKVVPLMDVPASYFGARGGRLGFNLAAAHSGLARPGDITFMKSTGNFLYRLGFVEENYKTGDVNAWTTMLGQSDVDFCFKEKQRNAKNAKMSIFDVYSKNYTYTDGLTTGENIAGPCDGIAYYDKELEAALAELHAVEKDEASLTHETNVHSINFANALDFEGKPYYNIVMADTAEIVDGAVQLSSYNNIMLKGAADGDLSKENFDKMVANFLSNFTGQGIELHDHARYPFTALVDSGYSLDTTELFYPITAICPLVAVITATQDVSLPINTLTDEIASASLLISKAYLNIESSVYQTPFTRGAVVPFAGVPSLGEYTELVPTTREIANKLSLWMGNGEGTWNDGLDADIYPNNVISQMSIDNYTLPPIGVREEMWENQLVAFEYSDMTNLIISGFQSINPNDTSILNGMVNVFACIAAARCAYYAYKRLVGNSKYTNEVMKKRGEDFMKEWLNGIGNERVIFVPEVKFTEDQLNEGYSWTTIVHVYAPGMKTVNVITVESHNISEFEG